MRPEELERMRRIANTPVPPPPGAARPRGIVTARIRPAAIPKKPDPFAKARTERARRLIASMRRLAEGERPAPVIPVIRAFGKIGETERISAAKIRAALDEHPDAREIALIIDSPGGELAEARTIYNLLRGTDATISARVVGDCASAATLLLLAADSREATRDATFVLHQVSITPNIGAGEKGRWTARAHEKRVAELRAEDERLAQLYSTRTNKPIAAVREIMNAARPFGPEKAVERGLIHRVVGA